MVEDDMSSVTTVETIDSIKFNSNNYVKKLLLSKGLRDLLNHDDQMVQQIKSLDGDMQRLVYENYNKFISVSETIKLIKNNVEIMESDMNTLKEKMEQVTKNSASLEL